MSGRPDPALRKGWCPGALRPMAARDGLLVRLRVTGGIVPARLGLAVADLAERHGNGLLDLSARANLQLRGVREESLAAVLDGLDVLGLLDDDADAEAVRNVLSSPLAGVGSTCGSGRPQGRGEHPDIRPLVADLERALVTDPGLRALPAKFGFLVDDGGAPSLAGIAADIRFDWSTTQRAFRIGLGGTAIDALALGLVPSDGLVTTAVALAHRLLARSGEPQRIARLIRESGPEVTLLWFGVEPLVVPGLVAGKNGEPLAGMREVMLPRERWGADLAVPRRKDEHATATETVVGFHDFDAVHTLGLAVPFGRLDAAMLRASARLTEAGTRELRLTPWRTILAPGLSTADLAALAAAGFIVDPADPRLRIAACTGRNGCERGTTDTHADAAALADIAAALPGNGVTLHVSGCAKGCARPRRTAVTLVGRDGRYDFVRDGRPDDAPMLEGLDLEEVRAVFHGNGD